MKNWDYSNEQWTQLPAHLKHLPLFTRHIDYFSIAIRFLWSIVLKLIYRFYIRLNVVGNYDEIYQKNPRLLVISNHSSHLDATAIAASIPFRYWPDLFIAAAKDYFFSNPVFTFFSAHCLGAIPIDRKDKKGEAIHLCISLLNKLDHMWLIFFPEGTRSQDGLIHAFKRGVSVFSMRTSTPILFLYLQGSSDLMPKGRSIPKMGKLTIHVGPIQPPAGIDEINKNYQDWVKSINPSAFG